MERSGNTFWLTVCFLLVAGLSNAFPQEKQPKETPLDSIRHQIKTSYLQSKMDNWPSLMAQLERQPKSDDFNFIFTLCQAQYGYIGYLLSEKKKKEAKQRIEKTMATLDEAIIQYPDSAKLYTLIAALIGYQIGLKPWKAPWLGPQSQENIELAKKLDPKEPSVWFEEGNSYFFRPAIFGGSRETAIRNYEKAWKLINAEPDAKKNWFYYYVGAWLSNAYLEENRKKEANNLLKELLTEAPDFKWVSEVLLPRSK
ncbi:tetratricopeptide repeat protein [Prolixibacter denitrificans]|uniref:Tetratricopeptide repeat protein n=2 Tax=Prolixibacter denitrificans TaxID=1541063 RepID=A0A2P8C8N0_9BACT|nr:tetratricopeptide repeat protein [Prolixibacter denitrificans]PSK81307.1 hypothetical protein CLV93_11091 [Prolixibacter denitrificans]